MIQFNLEKNKEHNSLCQIKDGDSIIYLTETDLVILINNMYDKRSDAFEGLLDVIKSNSELDSLKQQLEDMEYEKSELEDKIGELEDILDEEGIFY